MTQPYSIFITGASSGIGACIAKQLCDAGHNVHAFARSKDGLQNISTETEQCSGKFAYSVGDVTNNNDLKKAIERCANEFGGVDILIPNAGIGFFNPLEEASFEEWEAMIDVNITGVLRTLHSALPYLLKSKGQIINIGSIAARHVFPNSGVYCATKHAVLALSESLRIEYTNKLAITTINPGSVDTPFIDRTQNEKLLNEYKPTFNSGMQPKFIAKAVLQAVEANGSGIYSEITLRPDRR
ncbi:MAG: oxidoreductase [Bacteroidetes bacterium]|nr:MAG: oxidoreductase [Bacteroidota bacterium]